MSGQKTAKRKVRRRLTKGARREQILEAAVTAFTRGGYHGTHVDQIIEEAGVARGTFYLHFDSKHAVFATLVERMLDLFLRARPPVEKPETELRTARDAREVLLTSSRAVLGTFREHRRLGRLLFEEAVGIDKGFQEAIDAHLEAWRTRLRQTTELFQRKGISPKTLDARLAAEAILGMYERVTRTYVFREGPVDLDALAETIAGFEARILDLR